MSAARGDRCCTFIALEPVPPGEILMEGFMRPLGISIDALARALAVPPNRIGAIVNGTRAITADTTPRLGQYFGTSPETRLDLRSDCELRIARKTVGKQIASRVRTRSLEGRER